MSNFPLTESRAQSVSHWDRAQLKKGTQMKIMILPRINFSDGLFLNIYSMYCGLLLSCYFSHNKINLRLHLSINVFKAKN